MHVLLIDTAPANDLIKFRGVPVWPLRTEEDYHALCAQARLLGLRVRKVVGTPGAVRCRLNEDVVALGKNAVDAARLYAHLTRCERFTGRARIWRIVGDAAGIVHEGLV